jgi:hypothetical protein
MKRVAYVTLLSLLAMPFQTLTAHDEVEVKPEMMAKESSALSFYVSPARDIFTQGENIGLRFMFRNNGDAPERICTIFNQRKDLFVFFFRLSGNVNGRFFLFIPYGKVTLVLDYSYLELRSREFFSFTHTVNDIMREDNDNIFIHEDEGNTKQGDIITGKHVIRVMYCNQHGKDCFRGVLKAAEPVIFEIVERGKIPAEHVIEKPGGLEFSAVLAKTTFVPNEDILVDFTFSNTGKENVTILAEFEPFDAFFSVSGQNQEGVSWSNSTTKTTLNASPRYITLEPRESFGFRKKLNDLMDGQDAQEGRQKVEVKYANQHGEQGFKGELSSPVVEFEVVKEVPKIEPPEPPPSNQRDTQADGLAPKEAIVEPKGDSTEPRVIIEDETSKVTVRGPRETFRLPKNELFVAVEPYVSQEKPSSNRWIIVLVNVIIFALLVWWLLRKDTRK